jgi:hypothetical protein
MLKREQTFLTIILISFLVFFAGMVILGNGAYGGADNIAHFRIARYAFQYPRLFFDHWGKPVFTLLMAPAAQFGFKATQILNIIIGLATIFLAADLLKRSAIRFNPAYLFFVAFAPMYFLLMQSCLTEVLLSFSLVLSIWLFLNNKSLLAAVLLSFLPFIRTESVVVIPFFLAAFIWERKFYTIPLLLVGSLFYSVTGYFVYGDFLWIIHQMPYSAGTSIYGHGGLFDFVKSYHEIIGRPFALFLILGTLVWSWKILKNFNLRDRNFWFFILVMGSWMTYFAAHAYVWWQGTGSSLGLIRVMAGIIPLAAVPAVIGLNWLMDRIKYTAAGYVLVAVVIIWQVMIPFRQFPLPFRWERPQQLMAQTADYVKGMEKNKIFYFDPFLVHFLKIDPFDQKLSNWGVADKNQPSNSLQINDILVWDAHFGPNESGVQLQKLMDDPKLQLEKSILPQENFKVLGGYDYGIYVFRKTENKVVVEPKELIGKEIDFSGADLGLPLTEWLGRKCLSMDNSMEFSPPIVIPAEELKSTQSAEIQAFARFSVVEPLKADAALLILSIEYLGKSLSYNKADLAEATQAEGWLEIQLPLRISFDFPAGSKMNLYIWNKEKKKLRIAKFGITVKGIGG